MSPRVLVIPRGLPMGNGKRQYSHSQQHRRTRNMNIKTATHLKLLGAILAASACSVTQAADVFFGMDTDPAANGFILCGSHKDAGLYWSSSGGNPSTGGYFSGTGGHPFSPAGATRCAP